MEVVVSSKTFSDIFSMFKFCQVTNLDNTTTYQKCCFNLLIVDQFPIRLAFSMAINKSQCQTFDKVRIFLDRSCFPHGRLYVAFSRARAFTDIKVKYWNHMSKSIIMVRYTRNVVIENVLHQVYHFVLQ